MLRRRRHLKFCLGFLLAAAFAFTGCESLKRAVSGDGLSTIGRIRNPAVSGDPCGHADWFEVGRIDGLSGVKIEHSTYIGRCEAQGSPVDRELYSAGWQRGLLEYCTPERGYDAGRSGQDYQGICPSHVEAAFLKRFATGAKIAALERKNQEIENQVDLKLRELDRLTSGTILNDALAGSAEKNVNGLRQELQRLRDLRALNNLEIKELESANL